MSSFPPFRENPAYIAILLGYTFSVLKIKKMKWEGVIQDSLWSCDQF